MSEKQPKQGDQKVNYSPEQVEGWKKEMERKGNGQPTRQSQTYFHKDND